METLIKQIYTQAKMLGCCPLFKGNEDIDSLMRLFTTPQGLEFCMKHRFPNIATLRLFKRFNTERYGIYIDAGNITLNNPQKVILVGRTNATVNCNTLQRHEVYLLQGAKANVNASKWAVVFVTAEQGCKFIKNTSENAIIL